MNRSYKCPLCPSLFPRREFMLRHMRRIHRKIKRRKK